MKKINKKYLTKESLTYWFFTYIILTIIIIFIVDRILKGVFNNIIFKSLIDGILIAFMISIIRSFKFKKNIYLFDVIKWSIINFFLFIFAFFIIKNFNINFILKDILIGFFVIGMGKIIKRIRL